jgi:hypothetical protein
MANIKTLGQLLGPQDYVGSVSTPAEIDPDGMDRWAHYCWRAQVINHNQQHMINFMATHASSPFGNLVWESLRDTCAQVTPQEQLEVGKSIIGSMRDFYNLRWAHQKMLGMGTASKWRKDAVRCLNGTVYQQGDEGLIHTLYWFWQSDSLHERLKTLFPNSVTQLKDGRLSLTSVERGIRLYKRRWHVDYWFCNSTGDLYRWSLPQADGQISMLDDLWQRARHHSLVLEAQGHVVRDHVMGDIMQLRPLRLVTLPC